VIPPGADVHSFQTTPNHSIAISNAGLIVSNGGGLDDFLYPMIENAQEDGAVHIVASQGLAGASTRQDPHFWQNPANAVHYVRRIQEGLSAADPANAESYRDRADSYVQRLLDLDQEISQILSEVPPSRRHLVTYHDAFAHFGARYGWRTSSLVANDAGGVTPNAITHLQERVRQEGIAAVFTEPQFRSKVIELAARDTGVEVGTIYSDVLGGGSAADTYIDMMRLNARNLVELLR
jgi:ABC-type Zn uptake system ZnuABC Zn-binding protein ZnuA